jgi:hypothetical protein
MTQPTSSAGSSEVVTSLVDAQNALIEAVSRVMNDVDRDGVPSRTGMAMLRDAADLVKKAVPEVGKLRRRQ